MLAGEVKQSTSESAMFAGQNGEHSADLLKDLHGLVEEWKSTSMGSLQTQLNEMQVSHTSTDFSYLAQVIPAETRKD
jgi:hypothetical protein